MKVSLIVAIYKDLEALDLIIQALRTQTYKNFEVIIAEDNNSQSIKEYIATINDLDIKHTSQEDIGIRKLRSLNNGIIASAGDYLVFIDGDCIPYSTFIESHVKLAQDGYILSGRRVNLGPKYSQMLRDHSITPKNIEKFFLWRLPFLIKDSTERHVEDGLYFSPESFIYKKFIKNRNSSTSLLGCNYSCYRKDMFKINGYDEAYGESPLGDDTDLQWRFKTIGLKIKSCKNVANVFHLHHDRTFRQYTKQNNELELFNENKRLKKYFCDKGLNSHN